MKDIAVSGTVFVQCGLEGASHAGLKLYVRRRSVLQPVSMCYRVIHVCRVASIYGSARSSGPGS